MLETDRRQILEAYKLVNSEDPAHKDERLHITKYSL